MWPFVPIGIRGVFLPDVVRLRDYAYTEYRYILTRVISVCNGAGSHFQLMHFLKVILAVWTAVFLTLPSCPCQFFGALGISFEHRHLEESHEENGQYLGGEHEVSPLLNDSGENWPLCHCDEAVTKTAEESEGERFTLDRGDSIFLTFRQMSVELWRNRRGPQMVPFFKRCEIISTLSRSQTGVYRI